LEGPRTPTRTPSHAQALGIEITLDRDTGAWKDLRMVLCEAREGYLWDVPNVEGLEVTTSSEMIQANVRQLRTARDIEGN
jgi:hypothetical protein